MSRTRALSGAAVALLLLSGGAAAPSHAGAQAPPPSPSEDSPSFVERGAADRPLEITYTEQAPGLNAELPSTGDLQHQGQTRSNRGTAFATAGSDFVFSFGSGFEQDEKDAFVAAGEAWASKLVVDHPIVVQVDFDPSLPSGVAAAAGPVDYFGPADSSLAFPVAAANQLAGGDLNGPDIPEILIVLGTEVPFYTGVDDEVPPGEYSLATLAIHEIAHGLGHSSWADDAGGGTAQIFTWDGAVNVFDLYLVDNSGRHLIELGATAQSNALRSGVRWGGVDGKRLHGGPVAMFAPSTFVPGSSASHLAAAGQLMSWSFGSGMAILEVPPVTVGMLADIGWTMEDKSGDQAFVAGLTRDFLKRHATPAEIDGYVNALRSGYSRPQVVEVFAYSDEWVGVLVDDLYLSTLGRRPDPSGRAYWINRIRDGMTPAEAGAYFYAGAEFFQRSGGTNRLWVRNLYREILDRKADTSGENFWTAKANAGTPRSTIAFSFYQSIESRRRRVTLVYRELLGRTPDKSGREYWADVLLHGRDVELAIFIASGTEYYSRATKRF